MWHPALTGSGEEFSSSRLSSSRNWKNYLLGCPMNVRGWVRESYVSSSATIQLLEKDL